MPKKYWISLAVFTAVILGAGHFLTDGDWYIVRVLKKEAPGFFTTSEDPVTQAQRQLTEAQKGVVEAKHHLMEARRAVAEAERQMSRARQNEAVSRRTDSEKPRRFKLPENVTIVARTGKASSGDDAEGVTFGADAEPAHFARAGNAPTPVFQRPGVVWNRTGRAPLAPFQIITSPGADYFVKLAEAGTGREAVAVYVQGGTPVDVKIPLGAYTMRYAYGEKWYGEKHRFGPGELTRYSAAMRGNTHEILRFEDADDRYLGNTVELIQQAGGNLPTKVISADQF